MAKIFLSYRREDSAGVAGRIYDRLRVPFGPDSVFFDVDSVPVGVDFQEHIESVLSQCDVFLAVIGPHWAGESDTDRRIDNPEDWIRIEIEAALKQRLPVIPVLIDHTRMPSKADLPPSLVRLAYRHAVTVDQGLDFHHHVDRLIQGIELRFQRAKLAATPPSSPADSGQRSTPIPGRQPLPERHPSASDAAPRQQEPTAWSLLRGALPKRRWFYLAALLLLALPGIILTLKLIGNREVTPPPEPHLPIGPPPELHHPPQSEKEWTNSVGIKLVRIEAGLFLMGTTKDQVDQLIRLFPDFPGFKREWLDNEQPQHLVKITRPFFLAIHEVTQGQYQAVMNENPSYFKGSDDLPVESVSWWDALVFCNKLSEKEKKTPFYRVNDTEVTIAGGNGYRLPTEAEWEYACRAGSAALYPFGVAAGNLGDQGWHFYNSENKTHPVGQKRPNVWGLYDMLGNVIEWCQDWYEAEYYKASPPADPPGPEASSEGRRIWRGGGWSNSPMWCRQARRWGDAPGHRYGSLGFRVAAFQE